MSVSMSSGRGARTEILTVEVGGIDVKADDMAWRSKLNDDPIVRRVMSPAFPSVEERAVRSKLTLHADRWLQCFSKSFSRIELSIHSPPHATDCLLLRRTRRRHRQYGLQLHRWKVLNEYSMRSLYVLFLSRNVPVAADKLSLKRSSGICSNSMLTGSAKQVRGRGSSGLQRAL